VRELAAFLVGSLMFTLFAVAIVVGVSTGRPWMGGAAMTTAGLVGLGVILYLR
jgi:hypothetical protein